MGIPDTSTTTTTTVDQDIQDANQTIIENKILFAEPCSGTGDRCDAINGCVKIDPTFSNNITVRYKPFAFTPEMSRVSRNIITLPKALLNNDKQNIIVSVAATSGDNPQTLDNSMYTLNDDNITLTIHDNAFSNTSTYYVSYVPGIDITHLLPSSSLQSQQISIPIITDAPQTMQVTFNYTYQDTKALNDNKYYSPICKSYTLMLS